MRLLQFSYSPFAAKVRYCLALKQLDYELVEIPYTQRAELVKVSGGIGVPVLVDGATVVTDSPRITAYLETKGGPSLRAHPLATVLEQWADNWLEETAFRLACPGLEDRIGNEQGEEARLMFRLVKERRYGAGCIAAWRADQSKYAEETKAMLEPIVKAVQASGFVVGDSVSVADAAVAGQLHMIESALPGWVEANGLLSLSLRALRESVGVRAP
ncbi:MAG: glutathione S-transferase family protein [Archangium sp.]|nr:glutathione S-transferase family protein [Archangium sp.]